MRTQGDAAPGDGRTPQTQTATATPLRKVAETRSQLLAQFASKESRAREQAVLGPAGSRNSPGSPTAERTRVSAPKILMAKGAGPRRPGVVWDYQTLSSGSQNNYVFQSDRTTKISGPVTLNGTTVIEEGTVIKFAQGVGAKLSISGWLHDLLCHHRLFDGAIQNGNSLRGR